MKILITAPYIADRIGRNVQYMAIGTGLGNPDISRTNIDNQVGFVLLHGLKLVYSLI